MQKTSLMHTVDLISDILPLDDIIVQGQLQKDISVSNKQGQSSEFKQDP